jgi:hypothetical protein
LTLFWLVVLFTGSNALLLSVYVLLEFAEASNSELNKLFIAVGDELIKLFVDLNLLNLLFSSILTVATGAVTTGVIVSSVTCD